MADFIDGEGEVGLDSGIGGPVGETKISREVELIYASFLDGEVATNRFVIDNLAQMLGNTSTHSERCLVLLESGIGSDITLVAGTDKTPVQAHKLFLVIGSPVLRKKIISDKEKGLGLGKMESVEIPELNVDELELFLKFLYTGDNPTKMESALPLLKAATAYEVPELLKHCEMMLESELSDDSVLQVYEKAKLYNNECLMNSTLNHICKHAAKIVEMEQFAEISIETLKTLLEKDSLAVLDEVQLFGAVMKWANAEVGRQKVPLTSKYLRSVLEKVIHLVRYPQMTPADFSLKVAMAHVLTSDEIVGVLLYFNIPESQRIFTGPGLFNSKPRQYFIPTGELHTLVRPQIPENVSEKLVLNATVCGTKFRVNTNIWIRSIMISFNCFDSCYLTTFGENEDFKIKIVDPNGNVVAKKTVILSWSGTSDAQAVWLDKDLRIYKDVSYLLCVRLNSIVAKGKYYYWAPPAMIIDGDYGGSKVRFEFEDTDPTETKPFFQNLQMEFLVN